VPVQRGKSERPIDKGDRKCPGPGTSSRTNKGEKGERAAGKVAGRKAEMKFTVAERRGNRTCHPSNLPGFYCVRPERKENLGVKRLQNKRGRISAPVERKCASHKKELPLYR